MPIKVIMFKIDLKPLLKMQIARYMAISLVIFPEYRCFGKNANV